MPANGCAKPFVGIISFEKQKSPSVDIFDTKMDLNPPHVKFSGSFLYMSHRTPVNVLSIMRGHPQAFFYFQNLDKKDLDGT